MVTLSKAKLIEIDDSDPPQEKASVDVQFNPTTLRLQLANQVEGGDTRSRQRRQYVGSASTTLTLDLVFDTADEADGTHPVSVRTRTALVEKYVLPRGPGRRRTKPPPRLRFLWGGLQLDGVVDSVNIDFDHFAADGTPLRAKVGLSLKEQEAAYQSEAAGPGGDALRSAPALAGESAADFAARLGLDPAGWRGLADGSGQGLSDTLSLPAGLEIGFGASLDVGLGVAVGVEAGVQASLEARFGLQAPAAGTATTGGAGGAGIAGPGTALASAGGVGPALEAVKIARAGDAQRQAVAAFAAPGAAGGAGPSGDAAAPAASSARPAPPDQPRVPLARSGLPTAASSAGNTAAPPTPVADPRSSSFGFGVPLKPRLGAGSGSPPTSSDPGVPHWRALSAGASAVAAGRSAASHTRRCGCASCRGR
jgi:hypothetical protein